MTVNRRGLAAFLRSPREIALTLGAVVGLLCIALAAAALFLGIKPLVFRSGSMSPMINTGALAFSRNVPATELRIGDVVSVEDQTGTRITHRISAMTMLDDGSSELILRGDANRVDDAASYIVDSADRVFFHMNGAGYFVSWLSSPVMRGVGLIAVIALLVTAFRPSGGRKTDSPTENNNDLVSESASVGGNFDDVTELEVEK